MKKRQPSAIPMNADQRPTLNKSFNALPFPDCFEFFFLVDCLAFPNFLYAVHFMNNCKIGESFSIKELLFQLDAIHNVSFRLDFF